MATTTGPTLAEIQEARKRLQGVARETPVISSETLGRLSGRPVWLKAENLQRTGSFKIRGAYNRIANLTDAERAAGVVTASAGNHGQAVAWAAREAGVRATVFMPGGRADREARGDEELRRRGRPGRATASTRPPPPRRSASRRGRRTSTPSRIRSSSPARGRSASSSRSSSPRGGDGRRAHRRRRLRCRHRARAQRAAPGASGSSASRRPRARRSPARRRAGTRSPTGSPSSSRAS